MRISHNLPVPPPQPPTPSAEVLALRTNWKWAYLSHFLFTYNPILHLEDIQLSELEDDLANRTFEVIPTVMQRLLTSLTPHDKRSINENWQHHLRKQSIRRAPDDNLLGTDDEPVEFSSLIMTDKLHILYSLCEWQFHNPNNLRTRMRDDDDYANWRMEPIAYDAKANAYWLMGGNRLWIQHAPPPKRTPKSHKRKQPATSTTNGRKSAKRGRPAAAPPKPVAAPSKAKPPPGPSSAGRPTRSTRSRQTPVGNAGTQKPRTVGTRVSTRLRGREEEEVWQPIPDEWLKEGSTEGSPGASHTKLNGKSKGKGVETKDTELNPLDDVSELTSLSDLSELEDIKEESEDDEDDDDEDEVQDSPPKSPPDLSAANEDRWETVCVTLAEWEEFPRRFEKATHRNEKAFYKLLTNDLVPMITEVLRVDVRKKHMEEAVVHRKRSSRIAVKESVKEAERAEAQRKADAAKEMERHKRWEARTRKDEEDRLRREASRSARLREKARGESESMDVDIVGGESGNKPQPPEGTAVTTTPIKFVVNGSKTGTQTPKEDEPWELDCEICHRRGMNLDDGLELMSCGRCNKWQHIQCHDQADFIAGKPRRNWEVVDFLCSVCSKGGSTSQSSPSHGYPQVQAVPYYNGTFGVPTNGTIRPQQYHAVPDHRTAQPAKPALKQQMAFDPAAYNAGRPAYTSPQQAYPTQRPQPVPASTGNAAAYPVSAPQNRSRAVPTYNSTPNMYLSNYAGNYRPPQTAHNGAVQSSQPAAAHYRGQTAVASSNPGSWPQQQTQYNHLATWNGTNAHGSAPPYAGTSATQPYEQPQQNGYYRSHVVVPSTHLPQPQQIAAAQPYYSGGPTSQP